MAKMTRKQFRNLFKKAAKCVGKKASKIEELAAIQAKGIVKPRIFKSEDARGRGLGGYSESYKKARDKQGQTELSKVNLQFTDQLFASMKVAKFGGNWAFGVTSETRSKDKGRKKITNSELMAVLEKRYGTVIFQASDKEVKRILKSTEKEVFKAVDKCLAKIPKNITITGK